MKGLKFRVWDKERECYLDETELAGITPDGKYILYIEEEEISKLEIEGGYILEQYTGLKDKNGKEIYEWDIVSVRNKNRKNEYDIGVVEFGKAAFRCPFLLGKYHSGQVEVIGNIHENADLMEEGE